VQIPPPLPDAAGTQTEREADNALSSWFDPGPAAPLARWMASPYNPTMRKTTQTPKEIDRLIGPREVGAMIGLSAATVRSDVSRRPERLPPRTLVRGTNRLWWSLSKVERWLSQPG
jgi:predicted DNA-binding transcriptional regulator AlpA